MPISNGEVVSLVCDLAREDGLQVTVRESVKAGIVAGSCACIGGIVGGPAGIAVGSIVGGCVMAYRSQGTFRSAAVVLAELPPSRQAELAARVRSIVESVDATDAVGLALLLSSNLSLRQEMMSIVIRYIRNELKMQICD